MEVREKCKRCKNLEMCKYIGGSCYQTDTINDKVADSVIRVFVEETEEEFILKDNFIVAMASPAGEGNTRTQGWVRFPMSSVGITSMLGITGSILKSVQPHAVLAILTMKGLSEEDTLVLLSLSRVGEVLLNLVKEENSDT